MHIDTILLECFIAVAEMGSFTKAAKHIGRTQSAVSQQIAKLENLLDVSVCKRGKIISLTSDGEIFLSYAKQIFALHREAIDRFKEPELEGEVRFGLPESFASVYLSEVLADFSRTHPRIFLTIECDLTLNLYERFKQKKFDLVLVKMNHSGDFPNGLEVWSEPLRWVGDANLIDVNKPLPLVLAPKPCIYRAAAIKSLEKSGQAWRPVFSSPSYAGSVAALKAGMGISVMPLSMIPSGLHSINHCLLPELEDTHVSLLKHSIKNPAINSLENFVLKKLRSIPDCLLNTKGAS